LATPYQPVAGLGLGEVHDFQGIFFEIDEADLLAIPGEVARERLAEIRAFAVRLGDGIHRGGHEAVTAGIIGFAQAGIERGAVVAQHQGSVTAADHVGDVDPLRLQFGQAAGFGFAGGVAATVWRWAQGIELEAAGDEVQQAQRDHAASFAVLLQPGALPFNDDGLNHDSSPEMLTAP